MLSGKKVLLAVSGSIAAYKAAFFVRLLVKSGCEVKVIMTDSAKDFITPLTLATLSKNPTHSQFFDQHSGVWDDHVALGLWADVMIVAPASANTLAKMSRGICDNLLLATYLSAKCPVFFAPAMDLDMYAHPATQENIEKLQSFGNLLIEANDGELASGLHGVGRMAEPEEMIEALRNFFSEKKSLSGRKFLITSGPTYEQIDAVRFIGNESTGKMGLHLAQECANRGAQVTFVSGPVGNYPEGSGIEVIKVRSAREMLEATSVSFPSQDVCIFSAAVSDYRPEQAHDKKLKKNGSALNISLVENPDIAAEMGRKKSPGQLTVGFALETHDEHLNAVKKLEKKNFDLIVLNSLRDPGAGFSHDTNKITIYNKDNKASAFELKTKQQVAQDIVNAIEEELNA